MREKLQKLMSTEQLTSSRFAELLGIQPSGVSHLLGGRNKPSFDLVQKILRRFPRVNPDWLLLDKDEMYRPTDIESQPAISQSITKEEITDGAMQQSPVSGMTTSATNSTNASTAAQQITAAFAPKNGNVKRVIILFDDHTFESYEVSR